MMTSSQFSAWAFACSLGQADPWCAGPEHQHKCCLREKSQVAAGGVGLKTLRKCLQMPPSCMLATTTLTISSPESSCSSSIYKLGTLHSIYSTSHIWGIYTLYRKYIRRYMYTHYMNTDATHAPKHPTKKALLIVKECLQTARPKSPRHREQA